MKGRLFQIFNVRYQHEDAVLGQSDMFFQDQILLKYRPIGTVETHDGGQPISGLVDCGAPLDFVSKKFVRRLSLSTRKSQTTTPTRLANGQRVTSSTFCDITLQLARQLRVSTDFLRST
jgi:hypothetical protein